MATNPDAQQDNSRSSSSVVYELHGELAKYRDKLEKCEGTSCAAFWRSQLVQRELPLLTKVARHCFAHMASSADAERAFSIAGSILTKKRNRMEQGLLNSLMVLRWNKEELSHVMSMKLMAMAMYATGDIVRSNATVGRPAERRRPDPRARRRS